MDTNKILSEINGNMEELLQLISNFNNNQFNAIPFEGSWTAAQLARHVEMSSTGFIQMLNGPVKETKRNAEEFVEKIKNDFLDFKTKMPSPDFVVPPAIVYNKENLQRSLKDIQATLNQAIKTLDLDKTCLAFELPVYGYLTRLEAVYFINFHTQRHIHQLKNICQKLAVNINVSAPLKNYD